jgi:4-hydroxybenzoate polyprenyltransferase
MPSPCQLVSRYASFVKLAHTVFALPFAMAAMAAAYAVPTGFLYVLPGPDGTPAVGSFDQHVDFSWLVFALILGCMVGARTFAMSLNRILDRRVDAINPRTAKRELPSGALTLPQAWLFAGSAALVYFTACVALGSVVLLLSPVPILLMTVYPLTKRFTWLCHVVLGASLGLAPVGAWVAVRSAELGWQTLSHPAPWVLGAAVMLWVAGFDIIYALQDDEFDRANRLHSIPARFGRRRALWISRAIHVASASLFFVFVWLLLNPQPLRSGMDVSQYSQMASWVWVAPVVMALGMIYQQALVKPNDLSRVNMAFFTVNGVIAVAFGAAFVAAWLLA